MLSANTEEVGEFVGSRLVPGEQTIRKWICLLAFSGAIASLTGCDSHRVIEEARTRGAETGRDEGRRTGDATGFKDGYNAGRDDAFKETYGGLYSSGRYKVNGFLAYVAVLGSFALGFGLQWIMFFLPRRLGLLLDIDRILLRPEISKVDLAAVIASPQKGQKQPPISAGALLALLLVLPISGCKSREQEAWREGYDANHSAAFLEGWQEGAARGRRVGTQGNRSPSVPGNWRS
jgi:hypothetical protein